MHAAPIAIAAGLVAALTLVGSARAESALPGRPRPPGEQSPPKDPTAEIVEKLLTSEDSELRDLEWLFSNADEYRPSDLTDEPIPAPGLPSRGEGSPRVWDPRWRKFGPVNWVLTGGSVLATAASLFIPPVENRWRSRNGLDEWGRRTLGDGRYEDRFWARDLSDVLVSLNVAFPLLVDSLVVMYWYRQSSEVASQMALITAESIAVGLMLQGLTAGLASRERPFVRDCGVTIHPELDACLSRDRYRSFFSGHTTNAFAAATVTCSHHARHAVFGDPVSDGLACGIALTSAATVGAMRVVGQRHYLTDVMGGAIVGSLTGLGVPWLLHYGPLARRDELSGRKPRATVSLLPMPNGVAIGGAF